MFSFIIPALVLTAPVVPAQAVELPVEAPEFHTVPDHPP